MCFGRLDSRCWVFELGGRKERCKIESIRMIFGLYVGDEGIRGCKDEF